MRPEMDPESRIERILESFNTWATPQKIESLRESCTFAVVSHSAIGFVMGGALGLLMAGLGSSGIEDSVSTLPLRTQMRQIFREMGSRSLSSAKSFSKIAFLFTGFECAVETWRAKHDLGNTLAAGCATGAVLGIKSGPQAAAMGCVGFAAFSAAIDHFMQERHDD